MSDHNRQEQCDLPLVLGKAGKPFASKKSAEGAMRLGMLENTHEPVEHMGGWALKKVKDAPAEPEMDAADQAEEAELQRIAEDGEGQSLEPDKPFAPSQKAKASAPAPKAKAPSAPPPATSSEEEVYWVRFQAKAHPNDPVDIILSVNGEVLHMQREMEVPLPHRYLKCADHCTYQQFRQLPGERRKVVATVRKYPYDLLRPGTMAEFREFRRRGDKQSSKAREALNIL